MARRTMAQRNARALRRLAELGAPAGPQKGAEYRLRKLLGERRGLTVPQLRGHARRRRGEQSVSELARRFTARPTLPSDRRVPQVVTFPDGGAAVTTSSGRVLREQLREAARRGQRVTLRITADGGRGPRTHVLDGSGEQRERLRDALRRGGPRRRAPGQVTVVGKVQLSRWPR